MTINLEGLGWRELLRLKKDLLTDRAVEIARVPGLPDDQRQIRERYQAEFDAIDVEVEKHHERAVVEGTLMRRAAANPIAADLWLLLADARDADDLYRISENIAGRFERAATPEPTPEADWSEFVPDILPTNPARPFEAPSTIDPMEQRHRDSLQRYFAQQPPPTHDDPLAQRGRAEQRRKHGGSDRPSGAEAVEAAHRQLTDDERPTQRGRIGTTTPEQRQDAFRRLRDVAKEGASE